MTENATIKTVEHAEPSAMPEVAWGWRRGYAFLCTIAFITLAWRIAERLDDVASLRMALRYAFIGVYLFALLYMAGASAEALGRIIGAIRTTRKETITTAPPPATITPERVEAGEPATQVELPDTPQWERPR